MSPQAAFDGGPARAGCCGFVVSKLFGWAIGVL
jgi:hypothetical protein